MTDEELSKLIAANVVFYRSERRWSQTDMGAAAGLSQQVISRVENAEGVPFLRTLNRIADVLEVPLITLFEPTPTKKKGPQR